MKITDQLTLVNSKPSRNRIVMPPMDTLMSDDGFAQDFHIQHYGARAYGGVGTIIVESTAVAENGRIREKDLGIWKDDHIAGLTKIAKIAHQAGTVIGVQLNHAGSKSEVTIPRIGATNHYSDLTQSPLKIATIDDLQMIKTQFVDAAERAKKAGFDFVEIHAAHWYFLSEIINVKLNQVIVSDDILVRAQIVIDIVKEISAKVQIPVGIRISFTDHVEGGMQLSEYKPLVRALEPYLIYFNVSSGETIARVRMADRIKQANNRLFRLPITAEVRNWTKLPLITTGNYETREDVQLALDNKIDGIGFGKALLLNPNLVVSELLTPEELNKDLYHWNNNIWFNYQDYRNTVIQLKNKK